MAWTLDDVLRQMAAQGIEVPAGVVLDLHGKYTRFRNAATGKAKKSAFTRLTTLVSQKSRREFIVGIFGDKGEVYRVEPSAEQIAAPEDRAAYLAAKRAEAKAEEERRAAEADLAAAKASKLWAQFRSEGDSPYLARKKVAAFGLGYAWKGNVVVPLYRWRKAADAAPFTELRGLQWIGPDGAKIFGTGTGKEGCWHLLRRDAVLVEGPAAWAEWRGTVFFAEGYATAATVQMAMPGALVVACFDAGNLLPVIIAWRERFPAARFVIAADDDRHLGERLAKRLEVHGVFVSAETFQPPSQIDQVWDVDGRTVKVRARWEVDAHGVASLHGSLTVAGEPQRIKLENAGLQKAYAAAAQCQAIVVFPDCAAPGATDFNDLHCADGLEAVRAQIECALAEPLPAADHVPVATPDAPQGASGGVPPASENGAAGASRETVQVAAPSKLRLLLDSLPRDNKGRYVATPRALTMILREHPEWEGVLAFNDFSQAVEKVKAPPWGGAQAGEWKDLDDIRCALWLEGRFGFVAPKPMIIDAVLEVAHWREYHPVRDYLKAAHERWEAEGRPSNLQGMGKRYFGAAVPDHAMGEQYLEAVFRKWMISAVARIFQPGCKADYLLILEGRQGLRKSTAFKVLFGEYFTDVPLNLGDKESYLLIQGVWGLEMAELHALNKSESSKAKLFFAQTENHYRPWYAQRPVKVPRQCVFCGTVNEGVYLRDETGNRRYWPVYCTRVDLEGLARDRDLIWGEVVQAYRDGEKWWPDDDERPMFEEEQAARFIGDAYTDLIDAWLRSPHPTERFGDAALEEARMEDVLKYAVGLDVAKWTPAEQKRVSNSLRELGWVRKRSSAPGRPWVYRPDQQLVEARRKAIEGVARVSPGAADSSRPGITPQDYAWER